MLEGLSGRYLRRRSVTFGHGWPQLAHEALRAVALTVLYFLVTRLSQELLRSSRPTFAFFWPPTGFATAVLICVGRPTRGLFLCGIVGAISVAELTLPVGTVGFGEIGMFVIGNVAEPIVTATLVRRYLGASFTLERSRDLLGLFAAALVGVAVSATWYTSAYKLVLHPEIAALSVWLELFLAHLVGFVTIAPLVISLFATVREPLPRGEIAEGILAVLGVVLITAMLAFLSPEYWSTVTPVALLLPILLWTAYRCRPLFSSAAAFVVSVSIVWITIFKIGHLGDVNFATRERLLQVQAIILVAAVGTLVLSVLFAERKENEYRLARANAQLKREQDNRLMNLEAVAAAISHEIKQPLSAIVTNADVLWRLLGQVPPDVQEARSAAGDVVRDGYRIDRTLGNLRELFGKSVQSRELIDVNELALKVLQDSRGDLSDHGIAPMFDPTPDLPPVSGHKGQLEEVFLNLIQNAIEAMATMGDHRALQVRTKTDRGTAVVVEIEDSGPGFNPEHAQRIFEAFETTKPRGAGLGLAICRTIIERHEGQLSAKSDGSSGALFRIQLPISASVRESSFRA